MRMRRATIQAPRVMRCVYILLRGHVYVGLVQRILGVLGAMGTTIDRLRCVTLHGDRYPDYEKMRCFENSQLAGLSWMTSGDEMGGGTEIRCTHKYIDINREEGIKYRQRLSPSRSEFEVDWKSSGNEWFSPKVSGVNVDYRSYSSLSQHRSFFFSFIILLLSSHRS